MGTIDKNNVPKHVAVIMDGNGRWATEKKMPRFKGHKEGLETVKKIIKCARNIGVKYISLYTFSTENWKRTQEEVNYLMGLIISHLRKEFKFYKENGVRLIHIGDKNGLPIDVQKEINDAIDDCKDFNDITAILAINYGGKDEILRAAKKFAQSKNFENATENDFELFLDTANIPNVDLLIRTGNEMRTSNFLPWQAAYAEIYFDKKYWPDYNEDDFYKAILDFQKRHRRFGSA
ncbi:MAG: di-trans,poly-cis-decaprenylcistransferase [Treponema sp.]|nr:di-trans,poly-cis-decaprenylcistransferase [Treponema sp.]